MDDYYYKFSKFLKEKYGEKVWKICIDAGLSCPNRSKQDNNDGCVFCRVDSFSKMQSRQNIAINTQVEEGIRIGQNKFGIQKFLVYFQASTNTYGPISTLKTNFSQASSHDKVVGLSIATRPDCLSPNILKLIKEFANKIDVWIELGLQSVHEKTLERMNRGHNLQDYIESVNNLLKLPVRICTHLMIGFPGETRNDLIETAKTISAQDIHEVKIHPLLILKDTPLEHQYKMNRLKTLSLEQYASLVCDFLENIPPGIVVQRLTAEAPKDILLAPRWSENKINVLNTINKEFAKRGTRQASKYIKT